MELKQPRGPFCQSCAMPMERLEDFGTDIDESKNEDYCRFCFQNGAFTSPDITMQQMIDKISGMAAIMKMSDAQAREIAEIFIPKLKRWQ